MSALFNLFGRLWLLRANPQDLPASRVLTRILIGLYFISSILSVIIQIRLLPAIGASVVDLILLLTLVYGLLLVAKVPERVYQTLTAILSTSILLAIGSTLVTLFGAAEIRSSLLLLLLAWYMVVFGHVLRQAVDMPVLLGALIALLYLMASAGLTSYLFFPSQAASG
jgi:hypothetical protein